MSTFEVEHSTCGKTRYRDKRAALTVANLRAHRKRNRRKGRVKALRAYPCPDCLGWHLTSRV